MGSVKKENEDPALAQERNSLLAKNDSEIWEVNDALMDKNSTQSTTSTLCSINGLLVLVVVFLMAGWMTTVVKWKQEKAHWSRSYRYPDVIYGHVHMAKTAGEPSFYCIVMAQTIHTLS